jgi:hypothetical protein
MEIKSMAENKKITVEDIKTFCQNKQIIFPDEYVKFLSETNGGTPEKTLFQWIDIEERICDGHIKKFIPLKYCIYDSGYYFKTYKSRLPKGMFPIADDWFGNLICICLSEKDKGKVFFWNHEFELDKIVFNVKNNKNLTVFIQNLIKEEDNDSEYGRFCAFIDKLATEGAFGSIEKYIETHPKHHMYEICASLIEHNKIEQLEKILDGYGYQDGMICLAATSNNLAVLQMLHERGFFEKSKDKENALIEAVTLDRHDAIRFLITNGVDIHEEDDIGRTAADHGRMFSDIATKKLLKELINDKTFLKKLESA